MVEKDWKLYLWVIIGSGLRYEGRSPERRRQLPGGAEGNPVSSTGKEKLLCHT